MWDLKTLPKWAAIALVSFAAGALLLGMLDRDRTYKIGPVEISASQNSPINKCKERQSGIEAEITSEDSELARISAKVSQKQKIVDEMRELYLKQGIAEVSNAREQADYDPDISDIVTSGSTAQSHRITSSYILSDNVNELRTMQGEYSRQQAVKEKTLLEFERLRQECFGRARNP